MTVLTREHKLARDYALQIADDVQAFRHRCQLPRLVDVVRTEHGVDLVVKRGDNDLHGLRVSVAADVNADGGVAVDLVTDAGQVLQSMRFRTVAPTVAMGAVAALVNFAQKIA